MHELQRCAFKITRKNARQYIDKFMTSSLLSKIPFYGSTENNVCNHISFTSFVEKHFFFETGNILGDSGKFLF